MNTSTLHGKIDEITDRIIKRSEPYRQTYLQRIADAHIDGPHRKVLGCSNLAHGFAACAQAEKDQLTGHQQANIGIISAYNDMLSAHQPLQDYPQIIKDALAKHHISAQFAGAVPAMCDGVTQSQPGMELSLFSRDVIAQSAAVGLSHNMFDGALYLGVCDKIVPGLMMAALSFGHLPSIFVPAGPMTSGISNSEKSATRQAFAEGKVGQDELLKVESASYHSPGTCTFYGTANSNQMLMEIMGLHLPGSSFVNANTLLRQRLTEAAAVQLSTLTSLHGTYLPIGEMIDEKSIVNAIIGLLATGGSTNHTIHLIAMARIAGIVINWDDFSELSELIPLLTRLYPNGSADVNHFHQQGGMPVIIQMLLEQGLLHEDVSTIMGHGLNHYTKLPNIEGDAIVWHTPDPKQCDASIVSHPDKPFDPHGGMSILAGDLGRSVIKTSALKPEQHFIEAPAITFDSQEALQAAYKNGELNRDFIAVIRYQGPKANGMPELHGLMPAMGALQDAGHKVAIVTDGRMSGASGKVISAIHMTPEALDGGLIAKINTGDRLRIDIANNRIDVLESIEAVHARDATPPDLASNRHGMGRNLFSSLRIQVSDSEQGASIFDLPGEESA